MTRFPSPGLTIGEKIELALIPAVSLAFLLVAPLLPIQIDLGSLLLFASAALLTQSLLRHLWLLSPAVRTMTSHRFEHPWHVWRRGRSHRGLIS